MNNKRAVELLGVCGRMIGGSKGLYLDNNPDNVVVFNSNVCTDSGKIWYGDIDITKDESKLILLSVSLGEKVYVLREGDARFENEKMPLLDKAVYWTDGKHTGFAPYCMRSESGVLALAPPPPPTKEEIAATRAFKDERRRSYKQEDFLEIFRFDHNFFSRELDGDQSLEPYSPIEYFYKVVAATLEVPFKGLDVTSIYVTENTDEFLKNAFEDWASESHPHLLPHKLKKSVEMEWFNYGPATFGEGSTPDWALDFTAYIRRKK